MTRSVVSSHFISLDGVAEGPDRFMSGWDDVVDAKGEQLIATQDAVVLGRRTYDEWHDFWPTSDIEPFATFINSVDKHVATSSDLPGSWPHATRIDGDLVAFVTALKAEPGGDIGVHASLEVTRALLAAGLVDELRLVVAPLVAGSGRRLLDGVPATRLEVVSGTTTPSGYLLVDYRVVGDS